MNAATPEKPVLPDISVPKAGRALRGLGETLTTTSATGSASLSVPIPITPGRAGFPFDLRLSYDSSAGNGPFGHGWQLSSPVITRKTDKGLPAYTDDDIFVLHGGEELVPRRLANGALDTRVSNPFRIQRYVPRIESTFSRIERWTNRGTGETHWRVTTRDNILSIFGRSALARVANPRDPTLVFSWLIEETRDDRGNVARYSYRAEDGARVDAARPCEVSRFDDSGRFIATAQRYLKRIQYGNRAPVMDREAALPADDDAWLFEAVFDYGEHDLNAPLPRDDEDRNRPGWPVRLDPFSNSRATFDVRTYRLCQRVLMFHRFDELGAEPLLVKSLDLGYDAGPVVTYLTSLREVGYVRATNGALNRAEWPALEFDYARPQLGDELRTIDRSSLDGISNGVETSGAQWTDLDGEGIPGVLIPGAQGWYYKRPLGEGQFGQPVLEQTIPAPAQLQAGQQLMDLGGDGNLDLVSYRLPLTGYFERKPERDWEPFAPFRDLPNIDWDNPELRFVDLDGDGFPDVLITEAEALVWHRSRAQDGFEAAVEVARATDERRGPAAVFSGDREMIQLADMSGDGLLDLVRVRNGEVCYWPSQGFARFGAKIVLEGSPQFDTPEEFDPARLRFADVDGSGAADIVYLGRDGVVIYVNQAGNSLASGVRLSSFTGIDRASALSVLDLLGRGTSCLVRSSPLSDEPVTYVDLAGGVRPHVLTRVANNFGAETRLSYDSSTAFYLADLRAGRPWITRLPFPVNVVTRVESVDLISQNRFVSRYVYHEGHYDGIEREFCGFGLVEQWDSEQIAVLDGAWEANLDAATNLPPVLTKTWFHTGVYVGRDAVSKHLASGYYREPGQNDAAIAALLLPDSELPSGLALDEEREACRALKGMQLRHEIYASDGSALAAHPYLVTEQCYSVALLQKGTRENHAVFLAKPHEVLSYHYERNADDPRVGHNITLEVDSFGNVLKSAAFGYARRSADAQLPLDVDRAHQTTTVGTYAEHRFTSGIDDALDYRLPLPCETRSFELIGFPATGPAGRYRTQDLVSPDPNDASRLVAVFDAEIGFHDGRGAGRQRRLIEQLRTVYRRDDLTGPLVLGTFGRLALPWQQFQLAFTPGLVAATFRNPELAVPALLANADAALSSGGYRSSQSLVAANAFPNSDAADAWWIPGGTVYYSDDPNDTAAQELAAARAHFFVPRRMQDPFANEKNVTYDAYDLVVTDSSDAVRNRVTARIDYRVLAPVEVTGPNGDQTAVAFDARGMVVGTAVMGRIGENVGDSLAGFAPDLSEAQLLGYLADPAGQGAALLVRATTRIIYDPFAYVRTSGQPQPAPPVACTLTRETHDSVLGNGEVTAIQHKLGYTDGFGREIQTKTQAEPGPLLEGGAAVTRWAGTGWTVYNNKGLPVRRYEPFFSATHQFELARAVGVSPVLFYDPIGRAIATLHPDGSYEKVLFDAWSETRWDANDTVLLDPGADPDLAGLVTAYLDTLPANATTWYVERQRAGTSPLEQQAAAKTAAHAATPATSHLDPLGRVFLTIEDGGLAPDNTRILVRNRKELDIDGNRLSLRDSIAQNGDDRGREVARYLYDFAERELVSSSIDGGARWSLDDVLGEPYLSWDSRGHSFRMERDPLRRPLRSFMTGEDPRDPAAEQLIERLVYGEQHPDAQLRLRGALCMHFDQSGVVTDDQHDFKGNSEADTRRFARDYRQVIDWSAVDAAIPADPRTAFDPNTLAAALAGRLEAETFVSQSRFDAMNRAIQILPPHVDAPNANSHVVQPTYNEANLVERIDVWFDRAAPNGLLDPAQVAPAAVGVANIDYDAAGRRTSIEYKNGVSSAFRFDRLTSRLTDVFSRRGPAFGTDCESPDLPGNATAAGNEPPPGLPCGLQNLHYTYDPVGNLTNVRDAAQHTIYFSNRRVDASNDYTYDALYRLIAATGREHLGQAVAPTPYTDDDSARTGLPAPGDGNALGRYSEEFAYDLVGNLRNMRHVGQAAQWARSFEYEEDSQLEANKKGNRLTRARLGGAIETYSAAQDGYDEHGNALTMSHLAAMAWSFRNQLRMTQRQVGANADRTWYVYDAAGVRVRKVTESSAGAVREERIYCGTYERYRRSTGAALVRETLHVMDGTDRLASVETRTQGAEPNVPARVIRFRLGNQLGSACVELGEQAQVISYEEYSPYGSTTLRTGTAAVPAKRYGFAGKERDDETGFVYFGARYYAPWLARWASCDPVLDPHRPSLYVYASANPVTHVDPDGLYDPAAFGKKLEGLITEGEESLLMEDRNVGTSLVNTGIATGATVLRGMLSILQVGTGAAQGVEDIKRGMSDKGDGWDVAIGVSRMLSDAGEIASASLGVAGNATKVARMTRALKVEKELNVLRSRAATLEKRMDDLGSGRVAAKSKNPVEAMRGQVKNELDSVKEKIGELAADKAAKSAGLKDAGNPRRLATGGKTPGQPVRQGIDKVYTGKKPFAKDRAVFVEAKANLDRTAQATKGVPLSTSGKAPSQLTQGSTDYLRNRLATAANSGNNVATNLQAGLNANRLRLESFAAVGDTAVGGSSKIFRLTGQSGAPTVSRVLGFGSEVTTMNLTVALDAFGRGLANDWPY